jgi:hypothetical protein
MMKEQEIANKLVEVRDILERVRKAGASTI